MKQFVGGGKVKTIKYYGLKTFRSFIIRVRVISCHKNVNSHVRFEILYINKSQRVRLSAQLAKVKAKVTKILPIIRKKNFFAKSKF